MDLPDPCRLEAMRAAQFSSRGATPHEEQALLRQAKVVAAQQETGQGAGGTRGKGSRGKGRGAASSGPARNGLESPRSIHAAEKPIQQGPGMCHWK